MNVVYSFSVRGGEGTGGELTHAGPITISSHPLPCMPSSHLGGVRDRVGLDPSSLLGVALGPSTCLGQLELGFLG